MTRMRKLMTALVLAAALATACGGNNENPNIVTDTNNTNPPNNNTGSNNSTTGTNNGGSNGATNNSFNNPDEGCEQFEEFTDMSVDITREFRESAAVDELSCRFDVGEIATDGAYIVKLEFSAQTDISLTIDGIDGGNGTPPRPAVELRRGGCEGGDVGFCDTTREQSTTLDANTPYYLVINGLLASGGFRLQVDADIAECTDPDTTTCSGGVVATCSSDLTLTETACPGDCLGEGCVGDTCQAPVVVNPTPNGDAIVLAGNRITFTSTYDVMGASGCEMDPNDPAPQTPWAEFFVQFQGVTSGQTIILDAEQSNSSYGFFVLDNCDATTCVAAGRFDNNQLNRFTHTAQADGDVLVAVEAMSDRVDRDFTIEASVRE